MSEYWERWQTEGESFRKIIERVENIVREFMSYDGRRENEPSRGIKIEKYHWDAPDITVSWKSEDGIERNLHILVAGIGGMYRLWVEYNAWMDDRKSLSRKWARGDVGFINVDLMLELPEPLVIGLVAKLAVAYERVEALKESDLLNISDLQPDPRTR